MVGWIILVIVLLIASFGIGAYQGVMFGGALMVAVNRMERQLGRPLNDAETQQCAEAVLRTLYSK